MNIHNLKKSLNIIKEKKPHVFVLGDIMLDNYISGTVDRISPEAPVPILNFETEKARLGGAGNVLRNLINLGAELVIATVLGKDKDGLEVIRQLESLNISTSLIHISDKVTTTKKTRFVENGTQLLRLDNDSKGTIGFPLEFLEKKILKNMINFDCVIISDYGKGVCSKITTKKIIETAKMNNIKVLVDPKGKSWNKYSGATGITPNTKEVEEKINEELKNDKDFEKIGKKIIKDFNLNFCLITKGADGMTYVDKQKFIHQKVEKKEVYDVSGAGDTVIACLAVSLSSNFSIKDAIELSSFISSEVVSYFGTTPFNLKMLNNYE